MGARQYGPADGQPAIALDAYHQSRQELDGLPQTVAEKIPVTNTPNIFSYRSYVFARNPALVQRYVKATKADVGGVGGHVVAAEEVKSIVAQHVLANNAYRGEPIFTSLIVTHTGDDVAVTGIMAESVDMSVVDQLMWDALQEGAAKAAELGLYGPGQDLVADAFTGNLRGAGPATVTTSRAFRMIQSACIASPMPTPRHMRERVVSHASLGRATRHFPKRIPSRANRRACGPADLSPPRRPWSLAMSGCENRGYPHSPLSSRRPSALRTYSRMGMRMPWRRAS